jgi:arginase
MPIAGPSPRSFTIIGVPIDSVGLGREEFHGTELSPAALRAAGLGRLGWRDAGDLDVRIADHQRDAATGVVGIDGVLETTIRVRSAVATHSRDGDRPFLVGGCCTLAPAALAGARDAFGTVGLIYVDGHLDLYDGLTSPTGEAADMPIAVILGDGPRPWVEGVAPGPVCPPEAIALLGHRDPDELVDLSDRLAVNRRRGLLVADAATIQRDGPAATSAAALRHVGRAVSRIWLHVDLDVLDEGVFPATDYLLPGGLDWPGLVNLLRPIATDDRLVGWSVACYNPEKDPDGSNGRAIVAAIEEAFATSGGQD